MQTGSTLTVTNAQLTDAGGYSVIVSNAYGSATSAVAQLTVNVPNQPSIITQPQDQNVSPGGTATFTVTAGGSEPLSYQWYFNTNTLLANATDPTLTITNVQPTNAGTYSVTVSNVAGGITSSNAVLTINTNPVAPVFTSQPASQVVLAGGTASFTAVGRRHCAHQLPMEQGLDADSGRDFVHPDLDERADPPTTGVTRSPLPTPSAPRPAARPA